MLIPVRGRYRHCPAGYTWSDETPVRTSRGNLSDATIGERSGKVEWRTIEANEANMAHEIASIVPTEVESVQSFVEQWGLPIVSEVRRDDDTSWLSITDLAKLVRRIREAVALASGGDINGLAAHYKRHGNVQASVRYQHVIRRGPPEMFLECADLASLAWCQIANQGASQEEYRRCGWCGTYFVVAGKEGHRRTRQYCSDRCRVAANRAKKRSPISISNPQ